MTWAWGGLRSAPWRHGRCRAAGSEVRCRWSRAVVVVIVLWAGVAATQEVELQAVAPGVYAALQPHAKRFSDSNAVIIVNDTDVIVIDAQASVSWVRSLIGRIRALTDKPVRTLVFTHWHGDHTQNAALYVEAFGDSLTLIGHQTQGEDIRARAVPQLRQEADDLEAAIGDAETRLAAGKARDGSALDDAGKTILAGQIATARVTLGEKRQAQFLVPTQTFDDRLVLRRGARTIELRHYRGHTRGDVVVYLPREKVLVTGDLLDDLPYGGHGYPRAWVQTLAALAELDFTTVIPGHGRVRTGKEHLQLVRRFFTALVEQVQQAVLEGKSLEATQAGLDVPAFRNALTADDAVAVQAFDAFVPATVERAWLEARGELPD